MEETTDKSALTSASTAGILRRATATYGGRRKLADPDTSVSSPPTPSNALFDSPVSPRNRGSALKRAGMRYDRGEADSAADTTCATTESSDSEPEKGDREASNGPPLRVQLGLARRLMADDDDQEEDELAHSDKGDAAADFQPCTSSSLPSDPFTGSLSSAPPVTSSASQITQELETTAQVSHTLPALRSSHVSDTDDHSVLSPRRGENREYTLKSSSPPADKREARKQRLLALAEARRAEANAIASPESDGPDPTTARRTRNEDEQISSDDSLPDARSLALRARKKAVERSRRPRAATLSLDSDADLDSYSGSNDDRPLKRKTTKKGHAVSKIKPLKKSERDEMDRMTAKLHRERSVKLKREQPQHYAITDLIVNLNSAELPKLGNHSDRHALHKGPRNALAASVSPLSRSPIQEPSDPIINDTEASSARKKSKYGGSSSPLQPSSASKRRPLTAGLLRPDDGTLRLDPNEASDDDDELMDPKEFLEQTVKAARLQAAKRKAAGLGPVPRSAVTVAQMLRNPGGEDEDDDLEIVGTSGGLRAGSLQREANVPGKLLSDNANKDSLGRRGGSARKGPMTVARDGEDLNAALQRRIREQNIKARLSSAPQRRAIVQTHSDQPAEASVSMLLHQAKQNARAQQSDSAGPESNEEQDDDSDFAIDNHRRRGSGSEAGTAESDGATSDTDSNSNDDNDPKHRQFEEDEDKENTPSQSQSSVPQLGSAAIIDEDEAGVHVPARRHRTRVSLLDSDVESAEDDAASPPELQDSSQRRPLRPISPDRIPMPAAAIEGDLRAMVKVPPVKGPGMQADDPPIPSSSMPPPPALAITSTEGDVSKVLGNAGGTRTASSVMGAFFRDGTQADNAAEAFNVIGNEQGAGPLGMTQMFEFDSQSGAPEFAALRAGEEADSDADHHHPAIIMQTPMSVRNRDAAALARVDELERQQRQAAASDPVIQYLGNDGLFTQTKPTRYFTDTQSFDQSQMDSQQYYPVPDQGSTQDHEIGGPVDESWAAPRTVSPLKQPTRRFRRGAAEENDDNLSQEDGEKGDSIARLEGQGQSVKSLTDAFAMLREGAKRQALGEPSADIVESPPVRSKKSRFVVGEAEESDEEEMAVTAFGKRRTQGGLGNIFDDKDSARGSEDGEDSDDDDAASLEDLVHNEREADEADKDVLARERFQQDIEADDAEQMALHQKAVDGELRKKKRQNDGDFMNYLDDDQEDEMYRNRVRNPGAGRARKRDVGGEDEMEKLALDAQSAAFVRAYHDSKSDENDLAFMNPPSEDSDPGDDASDEDPNRHVSHAEVRRILKEKARQKRKRAQVVSGSDDDEDIVEKKRAKEAWESDDDTDAALLPNLLHDRNQRQAGQAANRIQGRSIAFEDGQLNDADEEDLMVRLLERRPATQRHRGSLVKPETDTASAVASKWGALSESAPERRRGNPSRSASASSLVNKGAKSGDKQKQQQCIAFARKAKEHETRRKHSRLAHVLDRESQFSESQ